MVLKASSLVTLAFPKILDLFKIQAYDFYKVCLPDVLTHQGRSQGFGVRVLVRPSLKVASLV